MDKVIKKMMRELNDIPAEKGTNRAESVVNQTASGQKCQKNTKPMSVSS